MDVEEPISIKTDNEGIFEEYDNGIFQISNISDSAFQHLKEYCSFKVDESEYSILLKYPDLLSDSIIDILIQLAIRANQRNDHIMNFHFHRKYIILKECMSHGVHEFFQSLSDPKKAGLFFERVGYPPGYNDRYYDKLNEQHISGDNLEINRYRMSKFSETNVSNLNSPEDIISSHFEVFKDSLLYSEDIDLENIINKYKQKITDKYLLDIYNTQEEYIPKLLSQFNQRSIIIEGFFFKSNGIQLFFNWFNSMPFKNQLELLHDSFTEIFEHKEGFLNMLTIRQKLLVCPELSDLCALIMNDSLLLFELFNKISFKRENAFTPNEENVNNQENLETILKIILKESTDKNLSNESYDLHLTKDMKFVYIEDIKTAYEEMIKKDKDIKEIVLWILEKEREYYFFLPAILYLEWILEETLILSLKKDKKEIYDEVVKKRDNFTKFETWFLIYRTRILQLFVMNLVETCIYECSWAN